ncbi:MAG: DNA cytosine methyltransferase [Sedimentisphaerales bacterium]|nr:DNA cytosine methyltransferase [Sedimentisphaerales bacterium]
MAELFCGPGGLALGALRAEVESDASIYRIRPVWANDIDVNACATYKRNIHPDGAGIVLSGPVEKIDFKKTPSFDGLAFGFPCNDFSRVGEQRGINGHYGPLYSYGVKAISLHNPQWFIAENVSGLSNADSGETFNVILHELENSGKYGYKLTVHLYKFEEYGVPQQRHRIIIVGIRQDIGLDFKVPEPITKHPSEQISAKEAIENPPIPSDAANNELTRQSKNVVERLKYIKPGQNAWTAELPANLKLNVKGAKLSQIYRRLKPNKPSYTVTGSGGGGTHMYHWEEPRALTNRERARLQTFPDDFIFSGSKEQVRKQIGMAVPPKGAEIIFNALLNTLVGLEYQSVEANYVFE